MPEKKQSAWRFLWRSQDIRQKVLITLGLLMLFRLAANVPVPGINREALAAFFNTQGSGGFLDFLNLLSGGTIRNFTTNPHRRVDLKAQLDNSVDPSDAIRRLKERLATIPKVLAQPAPVVEVLEFTAAGPVLAVRPYCHNNDYWGVYFATNAAIREVGAAAGSPVPAVGQSHKSA